VKPGDFYVGIISFSSILVPGAIATAVLEPLLRTLIVGPIVVIPDSPAARWTAFLVSSYFIGHLIFLIGSYLDLLYDGLREKRLKFHGEKARV
jgi:hypothetical protein